MKKFDSINVIPFIDIMLVLLAIVLATASFISQNKVVVNVPESTSKTSITSDDLRETISITENGDFYYKETLITLVELDNQLGQLDKGSPVTIRIDAQAHFQPFVHVTDLLSKHMLKKVTVVTASSTASHP